MSQQEAIKQFETQKVRTYWDDEQEKWFFCINDVVAILTGTTNPANYIKQLKHRDAELAKGWLQFVPPPSMPTPGGKQQEIADHISAIRQQAKALQAEGKAILENAKKEVEKMLV